MSQVDQLNTIERDIAETPGTTVISADNLNDIANVGLNKKKGSQGIILIPQPSLDPNDPLNWSRFRKELHFGILCLFTILLAGFSAWCPPLYSVFIANLNVTVKELSNGLAFQFLFLAVGCALLQPLSMKIGKRPIYLLETVIALVSHAVLSTATDKRKYYAFGSINGFSCAAMDSLIQISIADIFFLHEHGSRFGIYVFCLSCGSFFAPMLSPLVVNSMKGDWKWCCYVIIIMASGLFIIQVFFLEESLFKRTLFETHENDEKLITVALSNVEQSMSNDPNQKELHNIVSKRVRENLESITSRSNNDKISNSEPKSETNTKIDTVLEIPANKGFIRRMSVYNLEQAIDTKLWKLTLNPFRTLLYPAVIWGSLVYGIQICWLSLVGITQSQFFFAPPYNFSTSSIGLVNLSSFVGSMFGAIYLHYTDTFQVYKSKKNNGIFEPEFRLWTMIPVIIINSCGLLMYGLGVHSRVHWICPVIGNACIAFGLGGGSALAMVYVLESYPKQSMETMVAVLVVRNLLGMIFTFVFQDWLDAIGLVKTTWMLFMFCVLINGFFILFIYKGKKFRQMTAKLYFSATAEANYN